MSKSKNAQLAIAMYHPMFADRETLMEAWKYSLELIGTLRGDNKAAAMTAMMVMLNTISKEILKNEEQHPLTQAFMQGDHAPRNV